MTLLKATQKVIDLAGKVRDYYEMELPKRHPDYPVIGVGEETAPAPPEEHELRAFLDSLPAAMVYQLLLLMYLGRGDIGVHELAESYENLSNPLETPEDAILLMMDKAPLADYLLDGLEELRKQNIDVNNLPIKKVKLRRR